MPGETMTYRPPEAGIKPKSVKEETAKILKEKNLRKEELAKNNKLADDFDNEMSSLAKERSERKEKLAEERKKMGGETYDILFPQDKKTTQEVKKSKPYLTQEKTIMSEDKKPKDASKAAGDITTAERRMNEAQTRMKKVVEGDLSSPELDFKDEGAPGRPAFPVELIKPEKAEKKPDEDITFTDEGDEDQGPVFPKEVLEAEKPEEKKPKIIGGKGSTSPKAEFKPGIPISDKKPEKRVLKGEKTSKAINPKENEKSKGPQSIDELLQSPEVKEKIDTSEYDKALAEKSSNTNKPEKKGLFTRKSTPKTETSGKIEENNNETQMAKIAKENPKGFAEAIRDKFEETPQEEKENLENFAENILDENEKSPEFLTEQGEKEITEAKKSTTSKLESKLVKTGFFNKETAKDFILNILSGKEDAWGSAKANFAEKQWSRAKEILQDKVEKAIYSIKDFDSLHENYCKANSKVFGKYIDNLEKAFKSSEYYNNKEMIDVQSDLEDLRGLFDMQAQNLAQWRGRNKGLSGLMRRFKLTLANKLGDKTGEVFKSINQQDMDMRKALEGSNKELMDKLKSLQSRINGEIDQIPEREDILLPEDENQPESVSSGSQEALKASEISTETEKRMGDLYSELINKSGTYGPEDLGKLKELQNMLDTNKDAEFDYTNKFGSTSKVKAGEAIEGINSTIKSVEDASKKSQAEAQAKAETKTTEQPETPPAKKKRLFERRSTPKKPESTESENSKKVELSKEKREELNKIITGENEPEGKSATQKLESLMETINTPNTPEEDRDIAMLKFLSSPSVDIEENLDFGKGVTDKEKALDDKLSEITDKYVSGDDTLSQNINSIVGDIKDKYNLETSPRAGVVPPREATAERVVPANA